MAKVWQPRRLGEARRAALPEGGQAVHVAVLEGLGETVLRARAPRRRRRRRLAPRRAAAEGRWCSNVADRAGPTCLRDTKLTQSGCRPRSSRRAPPTREPTRHTANMSASPRLGLIGLGAVGSQVSQLLAENGYSLYVADVRPASAFAELLRDRRLHYTSADEVCAKCDTVLTSLPSVAAIATVAERHIFPNLKGTWIDLSTTDEEEVKRLGPIAKQRGIDLLEAPLTGGVHLTRSGDMTVLIGGDAAVLAKHSKLLHTIGGKVIHCGGWGSGSVVKIISNMLAALHLVGVGEAFMLGKKSGIELPALWDALKASAGNSYVLETEGPFIMNGSFDTDFALKLHCKDLDIGYKMARALKSPLVLHGVAQQIYERARARYGDDAPSSMPAKLMEEDCHVKLQAQGFDGFTYQDRTSKWAHSRLERVATARCSPARACDTRCAARISHSGRPGLVCGWQLGSAAERGQMEAALEAIDCSLSTPPGQAAAVTTERSDRPGRAVVQKARERFARVGRRGSD